MPLQFQYSTLTLSEDVEPLGSILDQCFLAKPGDSEAQINRLGMQNMRLIRQSEQIVGGLATIPMGQWYGGQRVPMMGIAAVGIAPQYRGTGAAIALMQHTLNELYAKGIPISVLYPATQRLYRKAGYEQGGNRCSWEIPTASIQLREQPLPLQPVVPSNLEVFYDLYQKQAKLINGNLDRHPFIWQKIIPPLKMREYTPISSARASILRDTRSSASTTNKRVVSCSSEIGSLSHLLLPKVSGHSLPIIAPQLKKCAGLGLSLMSSSYYCPNKQPKSRSMQTWLLRVVDVAKALEKRGIRRDFKPNCTWRCKTI
jgi:predicted acetyltransferase